MNVTQVKDAIRYMSRSDKIEIYRWLDGELAGDLPFRIGSRRSIAIRQQIERTWQFDDKTSGPTIGQRHAALGFSRSNIAAGNFGPKSAFPSGSADTKFNRAKKKLNSEVQMRFFGPNQECEARAWLLSFATPHCLPPIIG